MYLRKSEGVLKKIRTDRGLGWALHNTCERTLEQLHPLSYRVSTGDRTLQSVHVQQLKLQSPENLTRMCAK